MPEPVRLYAAGSLRGALTEVAAAFSAAAGVEVEARYGPSGLLREEIAGGAKADIFASANMEHPAALTGRGAVNMFARNILCALVAPGLQATPDNLLERMLDPRVRLATSTPKADPSGDYAFEVFRKADAVRPGAGRLLAQKALQLTGGPQSPPPRPGHSIYGDLIAQGRADIFVTYRTNALAAQVENPGQQVVTLPQALAVGADYGMTVMAGAPAAAAQFAAFILSAEGQGILARYGFAAPRP